MTTTRYTPRTKRKVLVVAGTRPEAIKLLPLIRAMSDSSRIEPVVIATGQHPDLVERVLALDGLAPVVNFGVARPGLTLNELFAAILTDFQLFCERHYGPAGSETAERDFDVFPAACVVHGDTSSAAAAAVAAFHLRIPVVHVEAGLRTSDVRSPYPEELNRQMISRIAAFHLAPTATSMQNLIREEVPVDRIYVTGNTAIDALRWAAARREPYGVDELADLEHDEATRVVVITAHRRENWGAGLERIGAAIAVLARDYPDVRFVLPVHPNPVVAQTFHGILGELPNALLVPPMDYLAFARLLERACFAISDSGGVQEEAPSVGTPVLVVRTTTEREEGVRAGTLKLVGTDTDTIVAAARELLDDEAARERMAGRANPYGDGHAAERIVAAFDHVAFGDPMPAPYSSGFDRLEVLRAGGFDIDPRAAAQDDAARRGAVEEQAVDLIEGVRLG